MSLFSSTLRVPPECKVTCGNREITELYPHLRELSVEMTRQMATICTMEFETMRVESGHWAVQDSDSLRPWTEFRVDAVFGTRTAEIMRGFIRDVRTELPQDIGSARVIVTAQDESFELDRDQVRKVWSSQQESVSDDGIADEIARKFDLTIDVDQGLRHETMEQDATDIRFLRERAEANGFEVFVREGVLHFHRPRFGNREQPTILIHAGSSTNCLDFQVHQDGHRPDAVRMIRAAERGTDPDLIEYGPDLDLLGTTAANSENMGLTPFVWTMPQVRGASRAEATARTQAVANEQSLKIVADGELDGALYQDVLLTSEPVSVDGSGPTYDGTYYVDTVTHTFSSDGYRQRFRLVRNATGQQQQAGALDVLAAVRS